MATRADARLLRGDRPPVPGTIPEEIEPALCPSAGSFRCDFRETLEAMHDDGARVFVEVGPKGTLTSFVADTLRTRSHVAIAADRPQVSGILQLNQMIARLAAHGVRMRLNTLYERRGARRIALERRPGFQCGGEAGNAAHHQA